MNSRPLIQETLQILSFAWLNPFSSNLINRICAAAIIIGTFIDVCLNLVINYKGTDSTIEVLTAVGFFQVRYKYF